MITKTGITPDMLGSIRFSDLAIGARFFFKGQFTGLCSNAKVGLMLAELHNGIRTQIDPDVYVFVDTNKYIN